MNPNTNPETAQSIEQDAESVSTTDETSTDQVADSEPKKSNSSMEPIKKRAFNISALSGLLALTAVNSLAIIGLYFKDGYTITSASASDSDISAFTQQFASFNAMFGKIDTLMHLSLESQKGLSAQISSVLEGYNSTTSTSTNTAFKHPSSTAEAATKNLSNTDERLVEDLQKQFDAISALKNEAAEAERRAKEIEALEKEDAALLSEISKRLEQRHKEKTALYDTAYIKEMEATKKLSAVESAAEVTLPVRQVKTVTITE